jgi:hypothetical protein
MQHPVNKTFNLKPLIMKRILLVFLALFSFTLSRSQVIFNEFYVQPDAGNHEFFEMFNSSTLQTVDMDCYSLVVLYSGGNGANAYKGFYVLDFPSVPVEPLGYFVGAASSPFNYQKSSNSASTSTTADFGWNSLPAGSLKDYRVNAAGNGYNVTVLSSIGDLLYGNKESSVEVKYAFFLFNNGAYVNGFMGGFGTTTVPPDVTSMPPLELTTNCSGGGTKTINWATDIKSGEFVIETSGSDNGFIRKYDGKCGEWDKSSNPNPSRPFEHTPNYTNGAASGVEETNALSITTERTVCGTRIDYSITGIIRTNRYDEVAVFPIVVQLYKDNDRDQILDATDSLLRSQTIYNASDEFFSFTEYESHTQAGLMLPINPLDEYIVVFRTALGCIDKIVSPPNGTIQTTQKTYCGNQIDFSIDGANYKAGTDGSLDFSAQVYLDVNPNDGSFNADVDEAIQGMSFSVTNFKDTVTKLLPPGYEGKNYFVVYSSPAGCIHAAAFKAEPAQTSLTTTRLHTCGDAVEGDVLLLDVTGLSGSTESREFPLEVQIYYDNTADPAKMGTLDDQDAFHEAFTINSIAEGEKILRVAQGRPVLLVFKSKRGCTMEIIPSEAACATLPVALNVFSVQRSKQTVALKWETASEQNNRGFYVQRNVRGVWENIAFVFSAAEGGNSHSPLAYTYNDDNSEKGVSQYRIQQVDMDGKASYSVIRSVKGLSQEARTIIYPNPSADGKVNVVFEDQGAKSVVVSDISGRIVRSYLGVVNHLQIEGLESGMYTIQVKDLSSAVVATEKVIIKKR